MILVSPGNAAWVYLLSLFSRKERIGRSLVEKLFGGAAADVVDALHRFGIVADARVFFVQHAGGESKGFEEFWSLVEKEARTSYSPAAATAAGTP